MIVTRDPDFLHQTGVAVVVVRDDTRTVVVGETIEAQDLRARAAPHDTFENLLHGWDYYTVEGPFEIPGTALEVAATFPTG